jgi:biotin operon repressor
VATTNYEKVLKFFMKASNNEEKSCVYISPAKLAKFLDMPKSTVQYNMKKLRMDGVLIEGERKVIRGHMDGYTRVLTPLPSGHARILKVIGIVTEHGDFVSK